MGSVIFEKIYFFLGKKSTENMLSSQTKGHQKVVTVNTVVDILC